MFGINTLTIMTAVVAFLRVSSIVSLLPLFGENGVPVRVRVLLSVALVAGITPLLPRSYVVAVANSLSSIESISVLVIKEILIGVILGFVAKMAFDGIAMAASMVGIQMGFNTSSVFMPDDSEQTNGFSAIHRLLVVLIFLALNLHHVYIKSIWDSFNLIPPNFILQSQSLQTILLSITTAVFSTAIQLAAPILVGLLFSTAALGLVNRAVPQANVFVMSFPANFFVGLLIYMSLLPMLPGWLQSHFEKSSGHLLTTLMTIGK